MSLISDLREITRRLERELEGEPRFTTLASADFGTNVTFPVQEGMADYLVLVSNSIAGHTATATMRSDAEDVNLPLGAGGIINVPTGPISAIELDSTDSKVFCFYSDKPLLLGSNWSSGAPP
jgi:hypothetical protein